MVYSARPLLPRLAEYLGSAMRLPLESPLPGADAQPLCLGITQLLCSLASTSHSHLCDTYGLGYSDMVGMATYTCSTNCEREVNWFIEVNQVYRLYLHSRIEFCHVNGSWLCILRLGTETEIFPSYDLNVLTSKDPETQ